MKGQRQIHSSPLWAIESELADFENEVDEAIGGRDRQEKAMIRKRLTFTDGTHIVSVIPENEADIKVLNERIASGELKVTCGEDHPSPAPRPRRPPPRRKTPRP